MDIVSPVRVSRTYTQRLVAPPDRVFPLLCPVREADWIEDWDPELVISNSGVAERDAVFITDAEPEGAIWVIVHHDPEAGAIEMIKVTPEVTVCRLQIQLNAAEGGSTADVTYTHTSLGPIGDDYVEDFTEDYYTGFMQEWESQLNHYLTHGTALPSDDA